MQHIHVSFCFIIFVISNSQLPLRVMERGYITPLYSLIGVGKCPTLFEIRQYLLKSRLRIRVAEVDLMYSGISSIPCELSLGVMA